MSGDLERRLVSCLTGDPAAVARVWNDGLRPEVFEVPLYRRAFELVVQYWLDSGMESAPTRFVLESELPGLQLDDDVEEAPFWLADQLKRRFSKNRLQEILRDAAVASHEDPIVTLRELHAAAYEAAEVVAPRLTRVNMADNIDERRQRYLQRLQRGDGGIGLPLGISELDNHIGGLMPGELAVVGAYAKTGKTFFLVHTAVALRRAGYTPIFYTLEMSRAEIEDRIDAFYSGVSYNRLIHSQLSKQEVDVLHRGQQELKDSGGILVESPEEDERTVANLVNRARYVGADFVIIDQLSHMDPGRRTRDLKEHHGVIMKQFSVELSRPGREMPCLLAVQFNRESLDPNQELSMKHFANAAEIEREADLLLALSRNTEERRNNTMRLQILGARRADNKAWLLRWELKERSHISTLGVIRHDGTLQEV